nr:hypothetical protein FFPRI1PSEUD_56440 [Pseudomonas sp. FFPRI_1]
MTRMFKEEVRKGRVFSPTHRKFDLGKWDSAWVEVNEETDEDKSFYLAGRVFHEVLGGIRVALGELYKKHFPRVDNKKYLELLFSLSNRDVAVLNRIKALKIDKAANLFSLTVDNNKMGNEITLDEVAHGVVDGLEKAISSCVGRINLGREVPVGEEPKNILEFIEREVYLSQLYGMYEAYWQALLWGGFEFLVVDEANKIYEVRQTSSRDEVAHEVSQIRKIRLSAHAGAMLSSLGVAEFYKSGFYAELSGSGRKKNFSVKAVGKASERLQAMNSKFKATSLLLFDEFPKKFLDVEHEAGFSISEALEVFRVLVLLSHQYMERFPKDDSFFNSSKLQEFCVRVNKQDLLIALQKTTKFSFLKCRKIINFFAYKHSGNDLWCHPIVETGNNELCLLISALSHPVLTRVVEHWLVELNVDLQEKGAAFEESALEGINESLFGNKLVLDKDKAVSKRIKLRGGQEEEIDVLLRIGRVILVGEAKSIVTTDSPISYYRTLGILKGAAEQAKRKALFFESNIEAVFESLGWSFDAGQEYEFLPVVIGSNKIHSGFPILDVPVVDEKIIERYFDSNEFPMFSINTGGRTRHLAWFELYTSFDEMQANFFKYLMAPPQVLDDENSFALKSIKLPCLGEGEYKFIYSRLTPLNLTFRDRLERNYEFKLVVVDDIESHISDVGFVI